MSNTQLFKSGKAHGEGEAQADQWTQSARSAADSVSSKASDTAQSARENKEQTAGFLQQTGEQVMQIAHDAAGAMKNAVGMVGNNSSGTTASGTTTITTKKY